MKSHASGPYRGEPRHNADANTRYSVHLIKSALARISSHFHSVTQPDYRQSVNGGTNPNNTRRRAQRNATHFKFSTMKGSSTTLGNTSQALDRQRTLPFLGCAGMTPSWRQGEKLGRYVLYCTTEKVSVVDGQAREVARTLPRRSGRRCIFREGVFPPLRLHR